MPAMAQTNSENLCQQTGAPNPMHMGLTKREEFASRNMASLLSALSNWEELGYQIPSDEVLAKQAISAADALLAELEKPKGLTELEKELLEALELADEYRGMVPAEVAEKISKAIAKARGQL